MRVNPQSECSQPLAERRHARWVRTLLAGVVCALSAGASLAASAAEVCEFKDAGRRRISGENPSDLACIRQRAMAGDATTVILPGEWLRGSGVLAARAGRHPPASRSAARCQ